MNFTKKFRKEKFKEDFFKITYLLFDKITKSEQKSAYIPFMISVRDGRELLFYISEKDKNILEELKSRTFPKEFDLVAFSKILNNYLLNNSQYKPINGWKIYNLKKEFLR